MTSVDEIDPASLTEVEATRAGHASVDAVLAQVRTDGDRRLFRVEFTLLAEPDPREALAEADVLSEYDVEAITARLDRLDRSSKAGPWTVSALRVIGDNPERRAGDLSAMVDREKEAFKLDVRKLKNLGLTYSLRTGYELSPRGRAYIAAIDGIDGR